MKLKFERYTGMSCLYVRGTVDATKFKILLVGMDALFHDQEEPIILNFENAHFAAQEVQLLTAYKKKMTTSKFDRYWVSKEKSLGDFNSIDLFAGRILTNKLKQIGARIKADDALYVMTEAIATLEKQVGELGGTAEDIQKLILENEMLKAQKALLGKMLVWQHERMTHQKAELSTDEELPLKTQGAVDALKQTSGEGIDL